MYAFIGRDSEVNKKIVYDNTRNMRWVEMPSHEKLYEAVRYHADMLCCAVGDTLIVAPSLYDYVLFAAPELKKQVIKGSTYLKASYPDNIAYNVAFIGSYAVHNTHYTDPQLKNVIDDKGYEWVSVKQGYTNCMLCRVGDRSAITSDPGLARALKAKGLDILQIDAGHIELSGLDYGFIGGASMCIGRVIYFFGSLKTHPQGTEIREFIHKKGYKTVELGNTKLVDIGSVRLLKRP